MASRLAARAVEMVACSISREVGEGTGCFFLHCLKGSEFHAFFIGEEFVTLAYVEIVTGHADF
jgi:hypothetical protein